MCSTFLRHLHHCTLEAANLGDQSFRLTCTFSTCEQVDVDIQKYSEHSCLSHIRR